MNENAKKWVAALRSGKYKQGKEYLKAERDGEVCYCCLGVACELYSSEVRSIEIGKEHQRWLFGTPDDPHSASLIPEVEKWLGLQECLGGFAEKEFKGTSRIFTSLSSLNDSSLFSFDQIADFIESEPEGLFVKESDNV